MRPDPVSLATVSVLLGCRLLLSQPPPPGDARAVERRIHEIRDRLAANTPADERQKELAVFVKRYLSDSQSALDVGRRFEAQRLADAADACRRPTEHLQHVAAARRSGSHSPTPPGDLDDHLREVYFRLRLGYFFLQQIPAPAPKVLLVWAREFYERAVAAQLENETQIEDEYTKAADDLTHALESLAQAGLS